MMFKLYGYGCQNGEELMELREVTICIDSAHALALSEFFAQCAKQMEMSPEWEHEHFSGGNIPDLIVFNSSKPI
jgi:hypothetical protein